MSELEQAVAAIIAAGKRIYQRGLVAGTDGNISVRCGDVILISATNVSKSLLDRDNIAMINLAGESLRPDIQPSSEAAMHRAVYIARPEIKAVIHGHPPFATAYALAGKPFPTELVESRLMLGKIPLLPFTEAGTTQLADQVGQTCVNCRGVLLGGHGAAVWDQELSMAICLLEAMEQVAKTSFYASVLQHLPGEDNLSSRNFTK
ncbi:MAG: class II aldolase/adducin family protein [Clostridiales bacterium]